MTHAIDPESTSTSLRRSAARGGAITLAAQAAKVILALVGVVVLARLVSPSDFGLVVMVVAVSGVAGIFLDFGLSMSALRATDLTAQQQSNLFWLNTAAGLALAAVVFFLAWPIALFYGEPRLVVMTQWISLTYILGGLTAQFRVRLNRAMKFTLLAVSEVLAPLIALTAAVVLALLGYGIIALVVQQLAAAAVLLVLSVIFARWRPHLPRKTPGMRSLLSFGGSFAATQLLSYVTRNVDSVAIGKVWGPTQLGYYDRAFRLSVAPITQLNVPMTRVAMPVLSRVHDDPVRYMGALREAQLIACYATSSALLVLGGVASPLVLVLLGPEWAAVGPLLSVLAVSATFRAVQQISNWVLVSKGLAGSLLRWNLIAQPVLIVLILAGLPWGAIGVAVGGAIGYGLYWVLSFFWVQRTTHLDMKPLLGNALRVVGTFSLPAALLAFVCATMLPLAPAGRAAVGVVVALMWFGLMWLASATVRQDIGKLARFVKLAAGRG